MQSNLLLRIGRIILFSIFIAGLMLSSIGGLQSVKGLGALPEPNLSDECSVMVYPSQSLQAIANSTDPGDVVCLREGRYPGFRLSNKHGSPGNWIVFKSYPGETAVIDQSVDNYQNDIGLYMSNVSYIEINGLTFNDPNPLYDSDDFEDYSQGYPRRAIKTSTSSHYIRFYNNHIYHIGNQGIGTSYYSSNIEIIGNHIHDTGLSKKNYGIYLSGHDHIVRDNVIHDNRGYGIHVWAEAMPTYNILIEDNLVYNNGSSDYGKGYDGSAGVTKGDGIVMGSNPNGYNYIVKNNVIFGNFSRGIRFLGSDNGLIEHNTIYNNGDVGIMFARGTGNVAKNNISFANGSTYSAASGNSQYYNYFEDPLFVDPDNQDFHLQPNSPACTISESGGHVGAYSCDAVTSTPAAPTDTPTATRTATPTPSEIPTLTPTNTPVPVIPSPTITAAPTNVNSPSPLPGLSWEAEQGEISAPFIVADGVVSQSTLTDNPADGGRALYRFAIQDAGEYIVKVMVNAADASSNSFFVGMDSEPDAYMIWDIVLTNGYEERTVSWREGAAPEANAANTKVFSLAPGEHTLIIRGREANTLLDRVEVARAPIVQPTTTPVTTATLLPTQTPTMTTPPTTEAPQGPTLHS